MTNLQTDNSITPSISLSESQFRNIEFEPNSESFSIEDLVTDSVFIQTIQSQNFDPSQILAKISVKAAERFVYDKINEGSSLEVRQLLNELVNISSPLLLKWKKVYCREVPKRTGKASLKKGEIKKDSEWLKEFSRNFSSKWVALSDDNVVGTNDNLQELKVELKRLYNIEKITFLKL